MTELMNLRDLFIAAREQIVSDLALRGVNLPPTWVAECIWSDHLTQAHRNTLRNTFGTRAHSLEFIRSNMQ